jgi:alpha-beta hydrolase superfamily lysophospholipase
MADYFTRNGLAVIRFDFGGCGESTGSIADTTVSKRLKELKAVVAFARQHPSLSTRLGLLGSSLGGYVSLLYAAQDTAIRALSVWATPYNLLALRHNIPEEELRRLKEDFFIDAAQYRLESVLSELTTVQIIQGKNDTIVSYTHAQELFSRVSHPKELHMIPAGDHSLTGPEDRKMAIEHSMRWFQTYLPI